MRTGEDRPDPRHSEPSSEGSLPLLPDRPAVAAAPEQLEAPKPARAPRARRVKVAPPVTFASIDTMRRGNDLTAMDHAALRAYAAVLGVRKLDIENLTEDRLRQNCMLTIDERHAQLMED